MDDMEMKKEEETKEEMEEEMEEEMKEVKETKKMNCSQRKTGGRRRLVCGCE